LSPLQYIIYEDHKPIPDRTVSFRFDLGHFFGESSSLEGCTEEMREHLGGSSENNFRHSHRLLPMNFKGIRLIDCKNSDIKLYIVLSYLRWIVDADNKEIDIAWDKLNELKLEDAVMSCHYVEMYQKNPYLTIHNEIPIVQEIRMCKDDVALCGIYRDNIFDPQQY